MATRQARALGNRTSDQVGILGEWATENIIDARAQNAIYLDMMEVAARIGDGEQRARLVSLIKEASHGEGSQIDRNADLRDVTTYMRANALELADDVIERRSEAAMKAERARSIPSASAATHSSGRKAP